jgi:hypothetical protein
MLLKRSLAAFAAVIAALAVGALGASASAGSESVKDRVHASPSCPAGYVGPTNLATGCPYWMMS